MSYYKITFESNTIEGLKAIQGSFPGKGASATDSTTIESQAPPPSQQENLDASSGVVQAPPTADAAGANLDFSDPPPPKVADSAITDNGLEGDIPPPPTDE